MIEEVEEFNNDDIETSISVDEYLKKEQEQQVVASDNFLKQWLVNYTGDKLKPENNEVNLGMLIEVLAKEFPELVLEVAKENWLRGYEQALVDLQAVEGEQSKETLSEGNEQS